MRRSKHLNWKATHSLAILVLCSSIFSAKPEPLTAAAVQNVSEERFEAPKLLFGRIEGQGSDYGSTLNTIQRMSTSPPTKLTLLAPFLAKSVQRKPSAITPLESKVNDIEPMPSNANYEIKTESVRISKPLFLTAHLTGNQIFESRLNPLIALEAKTYHLKVDKLDKPQNFELALRDARQPKPISDLTPMIPQKSIEDEHPLNPIDLRARHNELKQAPKHYGESENPMRDLEQTPVKRLPAQPALADLTPLDNAKARHAIGELVPSTPKQIHQLTPEPFQSLTVKARPLVPDLLPSLKPPPQILMAESLPLKNLQAQLRVPPKETMEENRSQPLAPGTLAIKSVDSNPSLPPEFSASAARLPVSNLHGKLLNERNHSRAPEEKAFWKKSKPPRIQKPEKHQNDDSKPIGEDSVSWDEWFANFGKLGDEQLVIALEKYGNPAGANSVNVTVSRNNKVKITLSSTKESLFDKATLEAYTSLDGCKSLAFPKGVKRQSISFIIDNLRETAGEITGVNGRRFTGLKESR